MFFFKFFWKLTWIPNAPRSLLRIAKSATGALQQPAQKFSPERSANTPTYQQQQQQARAANIHIQLYK